MKYLKIITTIILITLAILSSQNTQAQAVKFEYDAAGNMVKRMVNESIGGGNCPIDITHSGVLTGTTFGASNSIKSTAIIAANQNIVYNAEGFIELNTGFLADATKPMVFLAQIEGCEGLLREENVVEQTLSIRNFPNPFTGETTIEFELDEQSIVSLMVVDVRGKVVATLLNETNTYKGSHQTTFNAKGLSHGIYYCTLIAGDKVETLKMVIAK